MIVLELYMYIYHWRICIYIYIYIIGALTVDSEVWVRGGPPSATSSPLPLTLNPKP